MAVGRAGPAIESVGSGYIWRVRCGEVVCGGARSCTCLTVLMVELCWGCQLPSRSAGSRNLSDTLFCHTTSPQELAQRRIVHSRVAQEQLQAVRDTGIRVGWRCCRIPFALGAHDGVPHDADELSEDRVALLGRSWHSAESSIAEPHSSNSRLCEILAYGSGGAVPYGLRFGTHDALSNGGEGCLKALQPAAL